METSACIVNFSSTKQYNALLRLCSRLTLFRLSVSHKQRLGRQPVGSDSLNPLGNPTTPTSTSSSRAPESSVVMAPSVMLDMSSEFDIPPTAGTNRTASLPRTLLLSPPSLASHPEKLDKVLAAHDRNATDIQMLDRLSLSLVSLPDSTFDIIVILMDPDNTRAESQKLLSSELLSRIVRSLKPGGRLQSQDNGFGTIEDSDERREAIFAGLILQDNKLVKPDYSSTQSVPLRLGKKKTDGGDMAMTRAVGTGAVTLNLNGKRKNGPPNATQPAGVGFVDFSDDFGAPEEDEDDDDLIDEDTLLSDEDLSRPVVQRKSLFHLPTRRNPIPSIN